MYDDSPFIHANLLCCSSPAPRGDSPSIRLLTRKSIELWTSKYPELLLSVTSSWILISSPRMSNSIPSLATSKTSNLPSQTPSPSQSQSASFAGFDNHPQRRSAGPGSFGAGSNSRNPSTPRNNQPLRKQHKGQRRPRLADEDAFAESVGGPLEIGA